MDKLKRNYSIDLLRFLSMLGIVLIHVLNQGGIIKNLKTDTFSYLIISVLYIIVISSVNIFAIISGYLYVEKKQIKYKNLLSLLSAMIFYSVVITIIFYSFNLFDIRSMGIKKFISFVFPPLVGRYWYITCYIFVFCMIPFINKLIIKLSKRDYKCLLIILFVLLSVISKLGYDYFYINNGYSPFWLIYCYFIGAYLKRFDINNKFNNKYLLLISIIICSLINFVVKNFVYYNISNWIFSYNSPFIVIISVLIFIFFSHMNIKKNMIIHYFSLTSFGVYLIHGHILIFDYVLKDMFIFLLNNSFLIMLVIIISFFIYVLCSIVEYIRINIFKIVYIDRFIELIGNKIDEMISL